MNQKKRELEQNELADSLGSKLDEIKPHLPKIALFSGLGVLGIVAIAFWLNTRKAVNESQWREYFVSSRRYNDSRGMSIVADIFPNTQVGNLALISAADSDYALGSSNIFTKREEYNSQLRKAAEEYEQVIQSSSVNEFAKMRATYALGYTYEALGRFPDAKEMYDAVATGYPDTPEGELAAKSLGRINDPFLTDIHSAFKAWIPSPDEVAPGAFGTDSGLPPRPDISVPQEMEQAPTFGEPPTEEPTEKATEEAPETPAKEDGEAGDDAEMNEDASAEKSASEEKEEGNGEGEATESDDKKGGGEKKEEGEGEATESDDKKGGDEKKEEGEGEATESDDKKGGDEKKEESEEEGDGDEPIFAR